MVIFCGVVARVPYVMSSYNHVFENGNMVSNKMAHLYTYNNGK